MARHYPFETPLNVPGRSWVIDYVGILIGRIEKADLWPSTTTVGKLPAPLARRLAAAQQAGQGLTITHDDLDTIPDDVWEKIKAVLPSHV